MEAGLPAPAGDQEQGGVQTVLDELGGSTGCSTLSPSGDLVVGRPEAVYLYSQDGRGPCFVVEGGPCSLPACKVCFRVSQHAVTMC